VRKLLRLSVISVTLAILLMLALTGSVFAHNGYGAGDGTGPYTECSGPNGAQSGLAK